MAINWDIWNTGLQNRLNEIGNGQYDWSFITPEVVQGFKKYQAQKKLRIPKTVEAFGKALKEKENYTDDELLEFAFNKELEKRKAAEKERVYRPDTMIGGTVKPATWQQLKDTDLREWNVWKRGTGRKTDEELETELRTEWGMLPESQTDLPEVEIGSPDSERVQRSMADGSPAKHLAGNIPTEEPTTKYKTGWDDLKKNYGLDKEALREELFKERYGSGYEEDKSIYDAYSKYNPYQRMIEAGKEASYWDPESGKIFVDAGQRMYDENVKAWEQTRKTAESNRDYALKMYEATGGHPGWLATATKWQNEMVKLDKSNPRINGQYFAGLNEADAKNYGNTPTMDDNVSKIWERVLNGYVQDENGKLRFMEEEDLEGLEGFSNLSDLEKNFIRKKFRTAMEGFRKESTERDQKALTTAKTNEPLYKRWSDNQRDIYNGSVIDFNKNAAGGYNYDQAANAFIYLADKGVPLDQILEAVPANKELRKMIFHDGKLDLSMLTQSALASAFSSLAAKGLWEENSNAIMNMAKNMYNRDLELNNVYSKQMRDYLTAKRINWKGTQFDSNMQFDPKSVNLASGAKTTGNAPADDNGAAADGASKWKNIDFAGLDAPTTGTIQGTEKVKKLFMKNSDKFRKRIVDGLVQLYWNGDKNENTLTWDNVSKKWISDQIKWSKNHPKPGTSSGNGGANGGDNNTRYTGGGF